MNAPPALPPQNSPLLVIPTSIDYTSKDFAGLSYSMFQYAQQAMPDWNTSSEGDFGVALVELFAYAGDIMSYYGDRISQEAYIPTATQRISLLNLAKLLDYTVSNGSAAKGSVTFQTASPGAAVNVPALTQVSTAFDTTLDAPIIYETDEEITVPANGGISSVTVTQGVTYSMIALGSSTGTAGQIFQIPQTGVIDGSISVFVQSSTSNQQWAPTQYLIDNDSDAMVFTSFTDANGISNIQFGDNVNGLIPSTGLVVYATYRIGVGAAGNQAAGVVGTLLSPLQGVFIPILSDGSTYDSTVMAGGADPESNDSIRTNAPQTFQSQSRAVSISDWNVLTMNVPGVVAVNAVAQHSTSVTLFVLGPGNTAPTDQLTTNILNYFSDIELSGVSLTVAPPNLVPIDVGSGSFGCTLQVWPNYLKGQVLMNVQTALSQLFQPPYATFGQLINVGTVYSTIMAVAGVEYVIIPLISREDVTQTTVNPIQLRQSEIATPGNFYFNVSGGQ